MQVQKKKQKKKIRPWQKMRDFLLPLSTYERKELAESLKQYGIQEPILVWKNQGLIIDGNTRWELLNGKIPEDKMDYFEGSEEEAFSLGVQLNFARRQLSNEQKKEIWRQLRKQGFTQEQAAKITNVDRTTISKWESGSNVKNHNASNPYDLRVTIPKTNHQKIHDAVQSGKTQTELATEYKVSPRRIGQIVKIVEARKIPQQAQTPAFPDKKYRCLVIDPPWPVQKIEREERPNQGLELDYPTMVLEEIEKMPILDLADSNGCHVFLWVTHKFLPKALELFEKWGVRYQCVLTWVKPTGMTPFSWMYNTEHVLFGRIGSLNLLKNGVKLSFKAAVKKHSQKPDKFFEIVRTVSPEPRLEMFARKPHPGFEPWGDEVIKSPTP